MNKLYAAAYPIVWLYMRLFHPWRAEGGQHIPEGGALLCGNHTTLGDPLYVVFALGRRRQIHVLAKEEIMKWPVIGWLLKKVGVIGIKRGRADVGAIKDVLRVLRAGEKLLLFPEGTRVKEGETSEAHTGAAMFATRTGVPIVPVYIAPKKRRFRKTLVRFGEAYYPQFEGRKASPEDYQRIADDLMERVRALGEEP